MKNLKPLMAFLIILITFTCVAQQHDNFRLNNVDMFNVFVVVDPVASIDDGLNIGLGFEYVGPIYAGLQLRTMPVLEDGYNEFVGKIGLPFISGYDGEWQYRLGIELGGVMRSDWAPQFGAEVALHRKIGDTGFYVFARFGGQTREDQKLYNYDAIWQWKGDAGVSYRFN